MVGRKMRHDHPFSFFLKWKLEAKKKPCTKNLLILSYVSRDYIGQKLRPIKPSVQLHGRSKSKSGRFTTLRRVGEGRRRYHHPFNSKWRTWQFSKKNGSLLWKASMTADLDSFVLGMLIVLHRNLAKYLSILGLAYEILAGYLWDPNGERIEQVTLLYESWFHAVTFKRTYISKWKQS